MSVNLTLVALEQTFGKRAAVSSALLTPSQTFESNRSVWLDQRAQFPISNYRVYTRTENERRIPIEGIETLLQRVIEGMTDDNIQITQEVAIGALYTDNLPISRPVYANYYVVVSLAIIVDDGTILRDPHATIEFYYGLRRVDNSLVISDEWYHYIDVSNVAPFRRPRIAGRIANLLINAPGGGGVSPGQQIRDVLRGVFNIDGISSWYVIPGDGQISSNLNVVEVRRDASFFVIDL